VQQLSPLELQLVVPCPLMLQLAPSVVDPAQAPFVQTPVAQLQAGSQAPLDPHVCTLLPPEHRAVPVHASIESPPPSP
jgi:hypothetical protein